jgi:hypothetical protein
MTREIVISTELRSIGYDRKTSVLEVEFQKGGVYRYFGVSEVTYAALMSADSKGRYFNRYIKDAHYYQRIA